MNSTLFPTLPSPSEIPLYLSSSGNAGFQSNPTYSSQPELDSSGLSAPSMIKRSSTAGPMSSLTQRQSSLGPSVVKKRANAIGAVSSHGRLYKVLGDLFLLAGRTEEAAVWFVPPIHFLGSSRLIRIRYGEAIVLFKTAQDPAWHASALEGMATISVLDAWSIGQGLVSHRSLLTNGDEIVKSYSAILCKQQCR